MGRKADPALAERNARILAMVKDGATLQDAADEYGLTRERARQIVEAADPEWYFARRASLRAGNYCPCGNRKSRKSETCMECWKWTQRDRAIANPGNLWTRDAVIAAMRAWVEVYGSPPGAMDWNPAMARRHGRPDRAARFQLDGCWPYTGTVQARFGSWNAALAAAGLPTRRTRGRTVPPARSLAHDTPARRSHDD